jgi:hypothetical protein
MLRRSSVAPQVFYRPAVLPSPRRSSIAPQFFRRPAVLPSPRSSSVAPQFFRRPEGASTYQPRATPWDEQSTRIDEALKGRDRTAQPATMTPPVPPVQQSLAALAAVHLTGPWEGEMQTANMEDCRFGSAKISPSPHQPEALARKVNRPTPFSLTWRSQTRSARISRTVRAAHLRPTYVLRLTVDPREIRGRGKYVDAARFPDGRNELRPRFRFPSGEAGCFPHNPRAVRSRSPGGGDHEKLRGRCPGGRSGAS